MAMKLGSATVFFLHLVINAMALVHKQSFPLRKPLSSKLRASQAVHSFHREFALYASKEPSFSSLRPVPKNAHRFVFMRHGESAFNQANIFTGWCDVALTSRGLVEAEEAGEVFRSHNLTFRHCYTSLLTRSIVTAQRSLEAAGVSYVPLSYDWRLNERHYGALQGLAKDRTGDRLGRERVMKWRRSYHARPPVMMEEHPHFDIINNDPRYRNLEGIPRTESLEDCQKRVIMAWNEIVEEVKQAEDHPDTAQSLLVAHANTLRALVMHIDNIPPEEIENLNIPTGIPFYYDIDKATGITMNHEYEYDNIGPTGRFRGVYISDDRKRRSFLERRRQANDPWLWALHDDQVAGSMLLEDGTRSEENEANAEELAEMTQEASKNTDLFTSGHSK